MGRPFPLRAGGLSHTKKTDMPAYCPHIGPVMHPTGIEPALKASEAYVLSVRLRVLIQRLMTVSRKALT